MEEGQRQTDEGDTENGGCSPARCRADTDEDTPSDEELVGTVMGTPQGRTEGAGMEDVYEESDGFSDGTDEEEGDGIQDMSQLGAGAIAVKLQTVHQQSYQLVGKDTTALAQHIVGCCQPPQGDIASAPQQQQQPQPVSAGDADPTTSQAQLSTATSSVVPETQSLPGPRKPTLTPAATSTSCVVPVTSLQVPGKPAVTPASTMSPRIPGSVVSKIQSLGLPGVPGTGDTTAVTQYNLYQVQQNFGDVTVKGAKNLNIGGTQNVGTPPTNQEEEEKPLTVAQKIRKRTSSRIQTWTKDMVETDALKEVKGKIDRGATWVTIKGRPGEGKSTTAYMALKDQYNQGRQVYQVESPEEFSEVALASKNAVIMLDDIFGDLEFDAAEWAKWRPRLRPIVDVTDPDTNTENTPEKGLDRTEDETTQKRDPGPNKDKLIIILVGREYVLKSSLADLGRIADYISSPKYVVEVSSQKGSYERRKIWRAHAKRKNIQFEESTVARICEADCPHGFPHVCRMFVATHEKDQTQLPETFFQEPIAFLNKTLHKLSKDKLTRSLFMAMIMRDGMVTGQEMEEDDSLGYECIAAADDLVGSYLRKEDDTYMFDHPSIYDSVALILSSKQSKFVIENCSLSFIRQRLCLAPSRETGRNVADETDLVANIPWTYAKYLARRFATEIKRSNLLHVLSHQACCNSDFVDLLMDNLKTYSGMSVPDILKLSDNSSKQSFCELLSSNKSQHIIKYLMEKENISFSQSEGRDILLGVCMNAACNILTYISGHMKLEMNARYGREEKTPLMLAAETRDSVFVSQILSLGPDLKARDIDKQTVFHYLCRYGLTSAVEYVINNRVKVDKHHAPYLAIENGHLEVVKLLVKRRVHINYKKGLRCAVKSQNANMVGFFLNSGSEVDSIALRTACVAGDLHIVEMLFEKGANVHMMLPDGDTPLLSSCRGNPAVVLYLLKKGACVNQVSNVTGDTPLHRAAGSVSVGKSVNVLLEAGAKVNVQNKTGNAPLHEAAGWGSVESVDVLLQAGADVNVQDKTGSTPLHEAARWGSVESVDVLLKAGAEFNVQNDAGDTPIHGAAGRGSAECVDVLLKDGAEGNMQNNAGDTPLHEAARRGSTRNVDVLLKAGADVNVQNNTGYTPLHKAAGHGSIQNVDVLLKAGADVNVQNNTGDTSLHEAAGLGSTECIGLLLKAGANVDVQNNTGGTPLHKAAGWGSTQSVDVLLKAGAHGNVQNNTGDTPLHEAAGRGFTICVDVLLKAGADVNVQNNTGVTPLHKAAGRQGFTECVNVLLKAGADVNVQNNTGDTPLHGAARMNSTENVDVLLKAGADVNVQNNTGDTPLHKAAGWGSKEFVDALLKAGLDLKVQNNAGDTPLHRAAGRGSSECVDVLLKAGADVNVQNNTGDTPLHRAAGRGSTECVDALLKAGADVNIQNSTGVTPLLKFKQ
ncbi:uncharacterized protein LOC124266880 isoform X8 [Haliotis rubra]|uniref:uncharacterized protein LOC124266880 isoform X8 n=1 Tax=Haliotis rubra TaxID=36100 RepID=UPI001EE5A78F|nr:uncharacterized protein LOC124266880 isoform X8 [Haliotis rubra]